MVPSDSVSEELSSHSRFILAGLPRGAGGGGGGGGSARLCPARPGSSRLCSAAPRVSRSRPVRAVPVRGLLRAAPPVRAGLGAAPPLRSASHTPGSASLCCRHVPSLLVNGLMRHLPGVTDYAAAPALPGSQAPPHPPRLAARPPEPSCKRPGLCEPPRGPLCPPPPSPRPPFHPPHIGLSPSLKGPVTSLATENRGKEMGLIKPGVVSGKNQHPAPHAHTCLPGSARRSHFGSLVIQMETSSLRAPSCLRTPLRGPSPGINHGQRPGAGRAAVAPRSEAWGRAQHPGTAPWWSRRGACPLPRSHSLGASSSARGTARAS